MLIPTIIMGVLAVVLTIIAHSKQQHVDGIKTALDMTLEIAPLLIFAFIVAGMVRVLLPHELLARWIGEESGMRGIFLGTIAGALTPGGPYVILPLAAGILRAGASVGTIVAFLTAYSLLAVSRLPMEVGFLGWKFALIRFLCVFLFPPIAGLIAQALIRIF